MVSYTAAVSNEPAERLRRVFADLEPTMETKHVTTAEQLMRRGSVKVLLTLLEQRFGPLPDATRARVEQSTPAELDRIARAVLTAPTLADVFGN